MDISTTLKENLTKLYVFYIPDIAISKLKSTVFEHTIPKEATNTIAFLDGNGQSSTKTNALTMLKLAGKKDLLDNNLYLLFEAKKNMEAEHFRILLDKYVPQVESHLFATKWMYNNIRKIFRDVEEHTVNHFALQAEYFENHSNELGIHFQALRPIAQNGGQGTLKHFEDARSNPDYNFAVPEPKKNVPTKRTKKLAGKQKAAVSDQEIDRFLLETVFNVSL